MYRTLFLIYTVHTCTLNSEIYSLYRTQQNTEEYVHFVFTLQYACRICGAVTNCSNIETSTVGPQGTEPSLIVHILIYHVLSNYLNWPLFENIERVRSISRYSTRISVESLRLFIYA